MKRSMIVLIAVMLSGIVNCKKEQSTQPQDVVLAKKYAKYRVAVRKEIELKSWAATLEKGEDIDLLQEIETVDKNGKKFLVSKVRLADGTEGYVESRHLADKVIVFIEDTPSYIRPTTGSKIHCKIPKGTIAFVVGEQANWLKIFAGKIGDVWVTEQWVQDGYSTDNKILQSARMYDMALEQLASNNEKDKKAGKQKLIELSEGDDLFASLAQEKLHALESGAETAEKTQQQEEIK